ncbi:hypothetical protein Tco_1304533 [Tanacetum coccineum]
MRTIIKEEVTTQLSQILPQAVFDFAILAIEKNVTESLEAAILTRSKEKKYSTTSKDASHSQHKPSGKFAQAEEPSHIVDDPGVEQDQEFDTGNDDEQPADKEVLKGPKRQSFYGFAANMTSSKDVYSRKRIIAVTRLSIMKKYDYGHLEEIQVRREDQELYTFREDERYDLNVALRMFTRHIVIQRRVEDLQLCVESYQKKLNLTKPNSYISNLRNRCAYTSYSDPHGTIYVDRFGRKRLMHADELHKFSDGTLNDVLSALHDIASGIRMEYLPKKIWSNLDKRRARQNRRDLPRDIPLDSVEVLRYDVKRSKSENKGIVPTEMELVLELNQQGTSHEVSISTEGVEELKRKVKIKGEKKEALLILRQKPGQYIFCQDHKDDC